MPAHDRTIKRVLQYFLRAPGPHQAIEIERAAALNGRRLGDNLRIMRAQGWLNRHEWLGQGGIPFYSYSLTAMGRAHAIDDLGLTLPMTEKST
jgi:hypothetical protein